MGTGTSFVKVEGGKNISHIGGIGTVSYTHLDVYKRQEKDSTSMWIGTSTNLFLLDRNSGKYHEIPLPGGARSAASAAR